MPVCLWTSTQTPTAARSAASASLWSTRKPTPPSWPGFSPTTDRRAGWSSTALASCMRELSGSCWSRPASLLWPRLMALTKVAWRALPGGGAQNCRCSGPPFTWLLTGLETTQDLFRQDEQRLRLYLLRMPYCRVINTCLLFCFPPGWNIH